MSATADPPAHKDPFEAIRQKINRLTEEVTRLSETNLTPAEYFGAFLQRVVGGLAGLAGAVWVRTPEGHLQLQAELNLQQIGINQAETSQQAHQELLRQAFGQGRLLYVPPRGQLANAKGAAVAVNPADCGVLFAPIGVEGQVIGLVEVWLKAGQNFQAASWMSQFFLRMAELASVFTRNHHVRQILSQQHLWTQMETFGRQIHASLNPTEVAYEVANEGRRLVECDRLSVGIRRGKRVNVEAISGVDVVENQSSLVQRMRALIEAVLGWGEKLIHTGARDDSLPPAVVEALDAYLAVSESKLLVVFPLPREQERESRKSAPSALLMECFDPKVAPDQLVARLDVIGRQAASALANAYQYRRIPMAWLWMPLAQLQEGLGGKAKIIGVGIAGAVASLVAVLVFVPYPLKMDAKGQLLPEERHWIYSPVEGQVIRFEEGVQPGSLIAVNQSLVLLYDMQLEIKLVQLSNEIAAAQQAIEALTQQETGAATEVEHLQFSAEKKQKEFLRDRKMLELKALRQRTHADESRPGNFWLKSPLTATLLNSDFRENLTNRTVKPSEPLLRIGDKTKGWEIELKIPQKSMGQILEAYALTDEAAELDIDLLLLSCPTRTFKGKLARRRIASQASPSREDGSHAEPFVLASVRLTGPGIAETERVPPDLLITGTEVHTRIRCGNRPLGYALFHGVWEFLNEKVLFFFF